MRNSSHPRTVVAQGALAFTNGTSRFGNALEIAEGARLVLLDASASITADSIAFTGSLIIDLPSDYTLDDAHTVLALDTALTADQLAQIVVGNPEKGKSYTFTQSGDGRTLFVTVASATSGAYTWNAGTGVWGLSGNWTPTGVPTHNDVATVVSDAAITMDAVGAVGSLAVQAAVPVTLSGDDALYVADGVSVVAGSSLTVSAPVRNSSTLVKDGSGTLTLAGTNKVTMSGDWKFNRGVTAFTSAAALGAHSASASAITISNCTFRYTGEATSLTRPLRIAGEYCAVLDIVGDLTFDDLKVSYANTAGGGIVKTGAGTLTLNVPSGTTTLSVRGAEGRSVNQDVNGTFAPSNGEVTSWDGVGQFSMLDGKVLVQGQGKDVSTVKQEHHCSLGGSGWNTTVAPELYLKDVAYVVGSGSGYHMLVDVQIKQGCPAAKLILDNAHLTANGLDIGYSKQSGNTDTPQTTLAITNSTLDITWQFRAPNASGMAPVIRIGQGGLMRRVTSTQAGGVYFDRNLDVRVEDGGRIEVGTPQNLYLGGNAAGDLVLASGGGVKVHRFLAQNGSTAAAVAFDGGYAQFTLNDGISTVVNPATTCFRADAGGGELITAAGVTHTLAIPLRGTGRFTKTGAGTLVFTNDLNVAMVKDLPVYSELTSSTVKVANGGGFEIAEGTVKCVAGTTDAASRFSGVGTLAGSFGILTLDVDAEATDGLTFADLTATQVVADFGRASDDPVPSGGSAVVAKIGAGSSFTGMAWKAENLGASRTAEFVCDANGVVTARFRSTGLVFIRPLTVRNRVYAMLLSLTAKKSLFLVLSVIVYGSGCASCQKKQDVPTVSENHRHHATTPGKDADESADAVDKSKVERYDSSLFTLERKAELLYTLSQEDNKGSDLRIWRVVVTTGHIQRHGKSGYPPIRHEVVFSDDDCISAIKRLLTEGADINARNPKTGDTALDVAILLGRRRVVWFLLNDRNGEKLDAASINTAIKAAEKRADDLVLLRLVELRATKGQDD
jgi:autotransporter-associated beta strand protein